MRQEKKKILYFCTKKGYNTSYKALKVNIYYLNIVCTTIKNENKFLKNIYNNGGRYLCQQYLKEH